MALLTVEEAKALLLKGLEWRAQQTAVSEAKLRNDVETQVEMELMHAFSIGENPITIKIDQQQVGSTNSLHYARDYLARAGYDAEIVYRSEIRPGSCTGVKVTIKF